MSTLADTVDLLRGRFIRLKGATPFVELVKAIGVSHFTLKGFVHGQMVSQTTLLKIEAWCNTAEAQKDTPHA